MLKIFAIRSLLASAVDDLLYPLFALKFEPLSPVLYVYNVSVE